MEFGILEILSGCSFAYAVSCFIRQTTRKNKLTSGKEDNEGYSLKTIKVNTRGDDKFFPKDVPLVYIYTNMKITYKMPVYINSGGKSGGISIPIGGGTEEEDKEIFHGVNIDFDEDLKKIPYKGYLKTFDVEHNQKRYINSAEDLSDFIRDTNIDQKQYQLVIPAKIKYTSAVNNMAYIFANKNEFFMGFDRANALTRFMRMKRPTLYYTSVLVALVTGSMLSTKIYQFTKHGKKNYWS
jgi:hypothetical protein